MNNLETILFNLKVGRTLECSKYKTHKFPTQNQHMKAIKQKWRIFGSWEMLAFRFSRFHFTLDWAHIWNIDGWNPCYVSEKSPWVPDHIWSSGLVHKNRSNKENSALQKLKTATESLVEFLYFFCKTSESGVLFCKVLDDKWSFINFCGINYVPWVFIKIQTKQWRFTGITFGWKTDFTLFSRKL